MRIKGVLLDNQKCVWIALCKVYGIGRTNSYKILAKAKINPATRVKDIDIQTEEKIRNIIDDLKIKTEGDLRLEINRNIRRLKEIESYRGARHSKNLPARGQRTKTNARTKRGKKITVGSGHKKSLEKT
ncbi:MAG: SSU ribosomal protein S13P [Candidatus Berkelbacteria bacterium Licking1014_7]|uniref:Small ribosomal subunit protein uS13 n=1 Tax=Candidatus Berkelbacteria bacterium Licking1014_7 TaxID=2017147 RepID=A0A554LI56_9BACT|nr:MAG: SSU ribosomal protein S13P [Candidatus Berkelbacteria bacterium Licking1014_7]